MRESFRIPKEKGIRTSFYRVNEMIESSTNSCRLLYYHCKGREGPFLLKKKKREGPFLLKKKKREKGIRTSFYGVKKPQ